MNRQTIMLAAWLTIALAGAASAETVTWTHDAPVLGHWRYVDFGMGFSAIDSCTTEVVGTHSGCHLVDGGDDHWYSLALVGYYHFANGGETVVMFGDALGPLDLQHTFPGEDIDMLSGIMMVMFDWAGCSGSSIVESVAPVVDRVSITVHFDPATPLEANSWSAVKSLFR